MQNAGRHNQVKLATKRARVLDRKPVQFQVSHPVGVFEIPVVIERRLADVDGHDIRPRIRVGKHRRLVGAAAGDEDV